MKRKERGWLPMSFVVLSGMWAWLVCCLWPQWSIYESYQYGCFVPVLAAGLFWRRWLKAPEPQPSKARLLPALIALLAAIPLLPARMIYEANSLWRTISWPLALPVVVITLCWLYLVGGRAWLKHFAFPVLFFTVALPWPGSVEVLVTKSLASLNTRAATEALFICGVPALQRGTTIELATDQVGVDEACSGIRSLHSALMISLFLGELCFLRPRSRLVMVITGIILTFLVNIGRTFALSWVCAKDGTAALQKYHDPIGIAAVAAYMTGLVILALMLRAGGRKTVEPPNRAMGLLAPVPALLCISTALWFVVVECGTRGWFRLRESNMTAAVKWYLALPPAALASSNDSKSVESVYRADQTTFAHWAQPDGTLWQVFYMRWNHGSKTGQLAKGHWPEFCMSNLGETLRGSPGTMVYRAGSLELPFRTYVFDRDGTSIYVFHCVWEERNGETSKINLTLKPNLQSRLQAVWDGKRNLGQQLLEFVGEGFKDFDSAEAAFARQLERLIVVEKRNQQDKVQARVRRQRSEAGVSTSAES